MDESVSKSMVCTGRSSGQNFPSSSVKSINLSDVSSAFNFMPGQKKRFRFSKNSHAISTMIIMLFRVEEIGKMVNSQLNNKKYAADEKKSVNIVHYLVISAFIYLPLLYMQLFIGHYSRLGSAVIGRIVPLCYGLNYTMIVVTVLQAVCAQLTATDSFYYFSQSFSREMPWMYCTEHLGEGCIGLREFRACEKEKGESLCSSKNISDLSAFRFRVEVLREQMIGLSPKSANPASVYWNLEGQRFIYHVVVCLTLVLVFNWNFYSDKMLNAIVLFYFGVILFLNVVCFSVAKNPMNALFGIFEVNVMSLLNEEPWESTALYFLGSFSLANVAPILIGSYMPAQAMPDLYVFFVWGIVLLLYLMCETLTMVVIRLLYETLGDEPTFNRKEQEMLYTIFPQVLGSKSFSPNFVSIVYFNLIFVSSLVRLKFLLTAIYNTVADQRPIIRIYCYYIRVFSCAILFLVCLPICVTGLFSWTAYVLVYHAQFIGGFALVLLSVSVLMVYGAQTLNDDHHFAYGSQPAVYYKLWLRVIPVLGLVGVAIYFKDVADSRMPSQYMLIYLCVAIPLSLLPQLIGLLLKSIYYLKRQDMSHLLRCEDSWGSPEPNVRKERTIYHPRRETNYFCRIESCKHECLRHNRLLPYIVEHERQFHILQYRNLGDQTAHFSESEVGLKKTKSTTPMK